MKTRVFSSGVLLHDGKILIIKRGPTAPRNPNMWDGSGGHLNENESAEDCMLREAKEECGLDVTIKKTGPVYEFIDEYGRAISIPFLLESFSDRVRLSEEHVDYKWVEPRELGNYNCVRDLLENVKIFGLV